MTHNFNIIKLNTVTSTNDEAKKYINVTQTIDFTSIIANEQTKGRGQRENNWHSETSKNLLFSIITKSTFLKPTEQFYLSKVISLGIIEYLNNKKNGFKIKWPNDIYYKNKKICGILIENSISGSTIKNSIIGIGININQNAFPNYLPNAISLSNILEKEFSLEIEFEYLLNKIYESYSLLKEKKITKIDNLYHKYLYRINTTSNFKDKSGMFTGKIIGTLPEGMLQIKTSEQKTRTYNFKEVEFLD